MNKTNIITMAIEGKEEEAREGRAKKRKSNLSPLFAYKNTIYNALPHQKTTLTDALLQTSLYESHPNRLKKERSNIFKSIKIPSINTNNTSLHFIQRESFVNSIKSTQLPQVSTIVPKSIKRHSNYLSTIQEKHQTLMQQSQRSETQNRASIEGTMIGFKNLKEKFLTLHQKSIDGKRWSQLLQRNNKSTLQSYSFSDTLGHHLDRYKKREEQKQGDNMQKYGHSFFKARLHSNKGHAIARSKKEKGEKLPFLQSQELSTFTRQKQLELPTMTQRSKEYPHKPKLRREPLLRRLEQDAPDQYREGFTPWQTQLIHE